MAVFFRTCISEDTAFERIEDALSNGNDCDGYFNIHGGEEEVAFSWPVGMSADTFRQQIVDSLRSAWEKAPFWAIYDRCEQRNDLDANDIRAAAIRLIPAYPGASVISISLLARADGHRDLEMVLVCFRQDSERRNFRVRYEGKFIPK